MNKILLITLLGSQLLLQAKKELPEPYRSLNRLPYLEYGWFCPENQRYLEQFIHELQPRIVVELGTWLGRSAIFMAQRMDNDSKLYAVDTWLGSPEHMNWEEAKRHLPTLYHQFLSNCIHSNTARKIVPVKMHTLDAAKALNIEADLIYVDASHETEDVYNDVMAWFPKVKKGGIMCGDDWSHQKVRIGVERARQELNVKLNVDGQFWYFGHKE